MSDNPTLSPQRQPEDHDAALGPKSLGEFAGQQAARANLRVFIEPARGRGTKGRTMAKTNLGVLIASLVAFYPATAWADTFDLNCTPIDAQDRPVEGARISRFHIDRDAARWCGGRCDPVNAIDSDDGKVLVLGTPPVGAGLTSRTTYDIASRVFVMELGMTGGVNRTRMLCEVEPFSGFTANLTTDTLPLNLRELLSISPLKDAQGKALAGTVRIDVAVDKAGAITACSIRESSGNPALDQYACEQASGRLRMKPATDAAGNPVEGHFRTAIAFAAG